MGWRGYLVAEFALVWTANVFMSAFNYLRLDIKEENLTIEQKKAATDIATAKRR